MAQYPSITLTQAGMNMIAQSQGGTALIFTKLQLGDGQLSSGQSIAALTALIDPLLTASISSIDTTSVSGQATLEFTISNSGVSTGFFARELGVFAKVGSSGTEQLFAYTNAGNYADYMPPSTSPITENQINVTLVTGAATGVSAVINSSLVYQTLAQVDAEITARLSSANPAMNGIAAPGSSTAPARGDHVHPTDTSRAPLASPTFTGTPAAPTPAQLDNSTNLATTAFVAAALATKGFTTLAVAVASNALTATLNAPCILQFRNPTLNSGTPVSSNIASNLSLTVPSGATLGTTAGVLARLVFLVAYNGGSPVLCVANLSGGLNLDETTLISPTTISSSATSANVIYSASAVAANSPFRVIGFCDISETTAGTWATGPTTVQGIGGQALAALQSFGVGQTWQTVTASRAVNTTYYNTTGRTICVALSIFISASSAYNFYVNGIPIGEAGGNGAAAVRQTLTAIIPPGGYYSITSSGSLSIETWSELR